MSVAGELSQLHVGRELREVKDVVEELRCATKNHFDFLAIPLADQTYDRAQLAHLRGKYEECGALQMFICDRTTVTSSHISSSSLSSLPSSVPCVGTSESPGVVLSGSQSGSTCVVSTGNPNSGGTSPLSPSSANVRESELSSSPTVCSPPLINENRVGRTESTRDKCAEGVYESKTVDIREGNKNFMRADVPSRHRNGECVSWLDCEAELFEVRDAKYDLRPSTDSDLIFENWTWSNYIVGCISDWIDVDNGAIAMETRMFHIDALEKQLRWASHLGVNSVLCPTPSQLTCSNYSRVLKSFFSGPINTSVWIRIPLSIEDDNLMDTQISALTGQQMCNKAEGYNQDEKALRRGGTMRDTWHAWVALYGLCDYPSQMGICLEFNDIPDEDCSTLAMEHDTDKIGENPQSHCNKSTNLDRWLAEPVRAVIVPSSVFVTNKKGYPVLSSRHKSFLLKLFQYKVKVILRLDEDDHFNEVLYDDLFPPLGESKNQSGVCRGEVTREGNNVSGNGLAESDRRRENKAQREVRHGGINAFQNIGKGILGGNNSAVVKVDGSAVIETDSPDIHDEHREKHVEHESKGDKLVQSFEILQLYKNYVSRLFQTQKPATQSEKYDYLYSDYLQVPLQPLQDDLESTTYETFERDPVKYSQYEQAVYLCLLNKKNAFFSRTANLGGDLPENFGVDGLQDDSNMYKSGNSDENSVVDKVLEMGGVKPNSTSSIDAASGVGNGGFYSQDAYDAPSLNHASHKGFCPCVVVMGAGRGPLVHASLNAIERAGITDFRIYAVEKNVNAVLTLKNRVNKDLNPLWRKVIIIPGDMRNIQDLEIVVDATYHPMFDSKNFVGGQFRDINSRAVEEKKIDISTLKKTTEWPGVNKTILHINSIEDIQADIMVSELLGSFGDNELSPECLDGAELCLKKDGVSIPCSYTSSLEPVSCSKLWLEIRNGQSQQYFDTPYVVKLHAVYQVAQERDKTCFTFQHPRSRIMRSSVGGISTKNHSRCRQYFVNNASANISMERNDSMNKRRCMSSNDTHNRRYKSIQFTARSDAIIHGFAGYFHCVLYKDVIISIAPSTFSEGMFSWFPLYLPIREPLCVKRNDTITAHIWRMDDNHKVWYEWCLTSPTNTAIQNSGGKSYHIGK